MQRNGMTNKEISHNPDRNKTENTLMSCFFSLPPKQFSLLSTIIGILLIDNLDLNQQNAIGNFIVGVGQTILIAAAQGQLLESKNQPNEHIQQQLKLLKQQIDILEQDLNKY